MKSAFYIIGGAVAAFTMASCEDFLDSENYTGKDSSNYPVSETDVEQMVAAVYNSSFYQQFAANDPSQYITYANLASDDMFGGGGSNDSRMQALDHMLTADVKDMAQLWTAGYEAIARANAALTAVDNIADEDKRNQTKGELLTLRALNYFDLVKCFGNIPYVERAPESVAEAQTSPQQVEPDVIYRRIAADLYEAMQIMPAYAYGSGDLVYGHVTRWAAESLLARVFLFYTGFYQKTDLPTADGCEVAAVTKDMVVKALEDVINNSGHELLPDFRSLWAYSNSCTYKVTSQYMGKRHFVAADANGNTPAYHEGDAETILAINYMYLSEWKDILYCTNQHALFYGVRIDGASTSDPAFHVVGDDGTFNANTVFPLGTGWGMGPVASNFYQDWVSNEPNDTIRRDGSIYNLNLAGYDLSKCDSWLEATGYHNMKLCAIRSGAQGPSEGNYLSYCAEENGAGDKGHYQSSHFQRTILIRFADVLLMHSELTQTADGLNKVRTRALLPEVAYSDQALRNERRWELAFEGLRWDDIRRWHIAPDALSKQLGATITNAGEVTTMRDQGDGYVARYNKTQGFYKIPQEQIDLAGGALKQNAGWEGTEGSYAQWN